LISDATKKLVKVQNCSILLLLLTLLIGFLLFAALGHQLIHGAFLVAFCADFRRSMITHVQLFVLH
jgi:hypothetical protein